MSSVSVSIAPGPPPPPDPAALLLQAAQAAKCAACGCAHETSAALAALPADAQPPLRDAARRLAASLTAQRYACLGCPVCWPAEALSALQAAGLVPEGAACPAEPTLPRPGWPPLAGDYTVLRYAAPVAVCALGDGDLAAAVAARAGPQVAITGTLTTENLGIDRLVCNTITNPHLRFVLVAGQEVEQRIGHHPGGSLLALAANGTDERGRIIGAPGRRPRLRNLSPGQIAHFRTYVEVVDLIGTQDPAAVLADGYTSVLGAGLVSRLDHAAYLGGELARAEHALRTGTRYRQDAAPGQPCGEHRHSSHAASLPVPMPGAASTRRARRPQIRA